MRAALLATDDYSFRIGEGHVEAAFDPLAVLGGYDRDLDRMLRVAHAVVELARGAESLRQRWTELARQLGGTLAADDSSVRLELPSANAPTMIGASWRERAVTTVCVNAVGKRGERFAIGPAASLTEPGLAAVPLSVGRLPADQAVVSSDPARTARRLGDDLRQYWSVVQPAQACSSDDEVTITLAGIEPDGARLDAAGSLARALTESRSHAFRSVTHRDSGLPRGGDQQSLR